MTDTAAPEPELTDAEISEQKAVRLGKRERLIASGAEAYPVELPITDSIPAVRARFGDLEADATTGVTVGVAGRVVHLRNTGKLCFATLQDGFTAADSGVRLQVMLSLAEIGTDRLEAWKADVDLGDFVSVTGRVISSRRGELSVLALDWTLASKALRPLPTLHK
ncbi:MAG: lysine--tRNA ligase, partial [Salinibacterium sp.]|nr:lysine--tRNA ligase [Salinibacterium sp.]